MTAAQLLDLPPSIDDMIRAAGLTPTRAADGRPMVVTDHFGGAVIEDREDLQWLAVDLDIPLPEVPAGREAQPFKRAWVPAAPMQRWLERAGHAPAELAAGDPNAQRQLRAIRGGERTVIDLGWVDEFFSTRETSVADIWPDIDLAVAEGLRLRGKNMHRPGPRPWRRKTEPAAVASLPLDLPAPTPIGSRRPRLSVTEQARETLAQLRLEMAEEDRRAA